MNKQLVFTYATFNPYSTNVFFNACVPGGGVLFATPLENQIFIQKNAFSH